MSDKVFVFAQVIPHEGKADALREALQALVAHTRTEAGFIQYDLHESTEKPDHFAFYEVWADQAALDAHAGSNFMKAHSTRTAEWVQSVSIKTYCKI
ncbi:MULTISPECIES: putative quinol monooxygenase [unclassified Aureimonas]|uniref:putative quinol monooxygenase n=1 Tax=unclassified Aureimonas TaxID=2615206 RepID=UPI0006F335D5|nr:MULTISPECIES: putative quinol monooxygenase [unclassified Aureimonas]KQT62906.1 antibiotic biosynthesis monooxygenase [Aureimonas sp. Leaf427]KQT74857.1 antibiotic biosynthesis monooxygenase [Aureimonas sp. Leaf460]